MYKNKKPMIDEKISNIGVKNTEMEEQEVPEFKDQKIIAVVQLNALMCAEILPAKNALKFDHAAREPQSILNMPNHTIQVEA